MLPLRLLLLCTAVPVILASLVDDEEMSLVQLTVERNWKRGKAKHPPAQEEMEDDISFVQTKVTNEHRGHHDNSFDCHHPAAGDGDVNRMEEGIATHRERSRPPLEVDDSLDSFSLIQTEAQLQSRSVGFDTRQDVYDYLDDDVDAEVMEVTLLQTSMHLNVERRPVEPTSALIASHDDDLSSGVAASDTEKSTWFSRVYEKLALKSWELHEWLAFALCLLVLGCVVWKASQAGGLKSKDLRIMRKWESSTSPAPPKRLSLTLPLRQLLDPSGGSVKLFGCGLAYVATLVEDEEGERTVQLAEAAEPTKVLMSVGPFPRSGVSEEGAAIYNTRGYTLGALQSTGPDSWSLSKNGVSTINMTSSAPFTLAISVNDPEAKEMAWVKPLSEAKEPDYVDLSICEGADSMLAVACAVAVLVASSSNPTEEKEDQEEF